MKEMVFHFWCDNPAAKHPKRSVEGDTLLVFSPAKQHVVEVDVCEVCQKKISLADAQTLADTFGREQTPDEINPALCCPISGCPRSIKPFKNVGGRTRHLTTRHPEYEQ